MENLQKYDANIERLKQQIGAKSGELDKLKLSVIEDNMRLETLRKGENSSIENKTMIDAIEQSNKQVDKEILKNNEKVVNAQNEIDKMKSDIEKNKKSLKQAILKNREEAKQNKAKAFAKYAMKNKQFNKGIEEGKKIKLKVKAYQADNKNKEIYKAASKEYSDHMKKMQELARERNNEWKLYNEASIDEKKVFEETQMLLNKYDLEKEDKREEQDKEVQGKEKQEKEEQDKEEPVKEGQDKENQEKEKQDKEEPDKEVQDEEEQEKEKQEKEEQDKEEPVKEAQQNESNDIWSKSKDKITSININTADGKAYVKTFKNNSKEINVEDAIENRKELFKRLNVNDMLNQLGVESKIKQFMAKRKINPVILKAICEDEELTKEYIESVIDNKEFPFEYVHNLENSSLSNKNTNFMNRLALKESKIEGNEILGAEKLRTLKNMFRGIKNKTQKMFKKDKEPEKLPSGEDKNKKQSYNLRKDPNIVVALNEKENERIAKREELYESFSKEQKEQLSEFSLRSNMTDVQKKYGISYNDAYSLVEKYGQKAEQEQPKSQSPVNGEESKKEEPDEIEL